MQWQWVRLFAQHNIGEEVTSNLEEINKQQQEKKLIVIIDVMTTPVLQGIDAVELCSCFESHPKRSS